VEPAEAKGQRFHAPSDSGQPRTSGGW